MHISFLLSLCCAFSFCVCFCVVVFFRVCFVARIPLLCIVVRGRDRASNFRGLLVFCVLFASLWRDY